MWGRHKKLKEWIAAGLLTDAQAAAIQAHEDNRKKGHFGRGLVNLSIFAILVGILSIIASNWYKIPGEVKIGVHVLLNIGIGALALWADKKGKDIWREGAALGFIGLTLTLIILIGQVFQLTGSTAQALMLWMAITLPFFLLMGKTYATSVPWMIAFLTTLVMTCGEYLGDLPEYWQAYFTLGLGALLPLAFMADGIIGAFRRLRPALADVSLKTGVIMSASFASMSIVVWGEIQNSYNYNDFLKEQPLVILAIGLAGMAAHAFFYRFYKDDPAMKAGALFAMVSLVTQMLPLLAPQAGNSLIAALAFIGYWMFIGWLAQGMGHMRLVSLAITIIAIRIFVVYIELFGSLFTTGVGLISGGVLMLGLIYGARKMNARLTGKGDEHAKA